MSGEHVIVHDVAGNMHEVLLESNSYYENDPDLFIEFCNVLDEKPKWATNIITHSKKHIYEWICRNLQILSDDFFTPATKIFWILNGIQNWNDSRVRCARPECSRRFDDRNVISIFKGYHRFCCNTCSALSESTQEARKMTSMKLYGVTDWMKDPENVKMLQDSFEKKHGEGKRSPMQVNEFKAKFEKSMMQAYGGRYTFECNDLMQKVDETNLSRYGTTHPMQNSGCKTKAKATFVSHYGVDNNMKCKKGFAEYIDGVKEKYGIPANVELRSVSQIPEVSQNISTSLNNMSQDEKDAKQKKYETTCLSKYGVRNTLQAQKAKYTMMSLYDVEFPVQSPEIRSRMRRKYSFDNLQFDSAPELAYYIWLKDNNVKFEFQPEKSFEYEHNGKKLLYFPDFFLIDDNQYVEIKGDHFFTESGQMTCPFRKKKWSDERYAAECAKYEAKHQCMLKNNVKIMRSAEYSKFVQYVQEKCGKDFFEKTRSCK